MTSPTPPSSPPFETSARKPSAAVILTLLYLGYLLSFADRVIFGLTLKPIKAALHFSDSQLGLLSGLAFAASYAVFSPLGGLLADRFPRKRVMALAVAFWSVATFCTGLAGSFLTMGLARMGVGAGESALHPLAVSLVADTVPRERRSNAFSVYLSAGAVGGLVALLGGGVLVGKLVKTGGATLPLLGRIEPWQGIFMAAAVPGLVLALVILAVMREPARESLPEVALKADGATGFLRAYPRVSLALFAGISMIQMGAYTLTTWNIVLFERVHGWTAARTAVSLALTGGVASLIGCLMAGRMITALRRRGHLDAPLRLCLFAAVCFAVFAIAAVLSPSPTLALGLLPLASFWGYVPSVAGLTAIGEALPAGARARLAGLHTLANGLIANALGPFMVGFFSDRLFPAAEGIRFALALTLAIAGALGFAMVALGLADYRRRVAELA
jgi:MFS family permease